ncbi:hypothetical protein [Enemella dayhoffiae]|uniref:hypothetical protein n=1 Tax=Enemella dayhoffiae TaxID=2016507 RepID=UPI00113FDFCC|nr:hypothetical protein [Enemella dayhoffiae]
MNTPRYRGAVAARARVGVPRHRGRTDPPARPDDETTSGAMGWLSYAVGARPELQDRLRAELAEVTDGAVPSAASARRWRPPNSP